MSDLPDYTRNIEVVAGDVNVAEYDDAPEDISDGERGPLYIDNKGRLYTLADLIKFKGVAFMDPTVENALPVSLEGSAIAYNACYDVWRTDLYDRTLRQLGIISGAQGQNLPQRTDTYELLVDPIDRAARLLGVIYGSRSQQLQQKASTYELLTYDSALATLYGGGLPAALDSGALKVKEQSPLAELKIWNGTYYLATPGVGDAIGRGVFILGSDYANPTPTAQIVKVDSSGRLSCVLG